MIRNKRELHKYIEEDRKANYGLKNPSFITFAKHYILNTDSYKVSRYLKIPRYCEYWDYKRNSNRQLLLKYFSSLLYTICRVRLSILQGKYSINISPNMVGYGLRIPHLNGGVVINCISMGNHCQVNGGCVIGKKFNNENRAIIGDGVELCVGSKVIGRVNVGSHSIIAPNSVVIKNVDDFSVVSGIPAKIIKKNERNV